MARATMASLIAEIRRVCNAGDSDSIIAGVTYWSDDQIEEILERHSRDFRRVPISALRNYIDGASTYTDYLIPISQETYRIERDGNGGGFAVRTTNGEAPPAYTVSWGRNMIIFSADTGGDTFYIDCRAYDINNAIADVYEAKAGFVSDVVDFKSDNHDIKARQEYDGYMAKAQYYRQIGGAMVGFSKRIRTDEYKR